MTEVETTVIVIGRQRWGQVIWGNRDEEFRLGVVLSGSAPEELEQT